MAGLRDTIKTTSSYFGLIGNSLTSTRKSFSSTNSTINSIKKNITNNTKIKKDLFLNSQAIRKQREEASKRKEMEDLLESSKVTSSATKAVEFVEKSDSPPFTRLLNALGYVTAGWIVENIPTWIFVGKEFVRRIDKVSSSVYDLTSNIFNISTSFNRLLQDSFIAIATFDFRQFTEGSVSDSFGELTKNLQDFGNKLSDAFGVFSVPLTQSLDGTQRAPGLGEERTQSLFPETPAPSSSVNQTRASYGTKEQRAMLDSIAWAEGGVSYRTMFGGGQFDTSNGWKHPDKVIRSGGLASTAAGRYQFLTTTWNEAASTLGLKDFSPINQDKAAIFLMDRGLRGNSAEILKKEGTSNRVLNTFAQIWAAVPMSGGGSYYGQSAVKVNQFKDKYNSLLKTVDMQSGPQQSGPSLSQNNLPPLPPTDTYPNQYYGAPRPGRKHAGVDFDINGPNAKFYSRIGGVVVGSPFRFGEDGWAIDIYNKELGVYERIAEAARIVVKPGQVVKPGDLVAQGESATGVIHYEIRTKREGQFENSLDPIAFLKSPRVQRQSQVSSASAPAPISAPVSRSAEFTPPENLTTAPTSAQISSPLPSGLSASSQLTPPPEKAAADLMIFTPAQDSAPPTAATAAATQLAPPNTISDFRLLNNFIKNKLLLDLAYL